MYKRQRWGWAFYSGISYVLPVWWGWPLPAKARARRAGRWGQREPWEVLPHATVSTMCTEKAETDPIAGKLLVNMINDLMK